MTVFISKHEDDSAFAANVKRIIDLQWGSGTAIRDCDVQGRSNHFQDDVNEAIDSADVLIFVASPSSLKSHECQEELKRAQNKDRYVAVVDRSEGLDYPADLNLLPLVSFRAEDPDSAKKLLELIEAAAGRKLEAARKKPAFSHSAAGSQRNLDGLPEEDEIDDELAFQRAFGAEERFGSLEDCAICELGACQFRKDAIALTSELLCLAEMNQEHLEAQDVLRRIWSDSAVLVELDLKVFTWYDNLKGQPQDDSLKRAHLAFEQLLATVRAEYLNSLARDFREFFSIWKSLYVDEESWFRFLAVRIAHHAMNREFPELLALPANRITTADIPGVGQIGRDATLREMFKNARESLNAFVNWGEKFEKYHSGKQAPYTHYLEHGLRGDMPNHEDPSHAFTADEVTIFFSHSSADKPLARDIVSDLKEAGIKVWFDEGEIKAGDSISQKIGKGLDDADYVAVLLSKQSIESGWVDAEWRSIIGQVATTREKRILPLKADDCEIPRLLRDKAFVDFSDRANYDRGLNKLLEAVGRAPSQAPSQSATEFWSRDLKRVSNFAWALSSALSGWGLQYYMDCHKLTNAAKNGSENFHAVFRRLADSLPHRKQNSSIFASDWVYDNHQLHEESHPGKPR